MSHLFPNYLSSVIRSVSRFIYAFYSLFLGLSPSHTLISVTFDSIIYALYSLSGLCLAHIHILSGFMLFRFIYAFYSLSGSAFSTYTNYVLMLL